MPKFTLAQYQKHKVPILMETKGPYKTAFKI
jgi:hypothetical protein